MKNLNLYALANELNLGDPKSGTIRVPFGRWDFGAKKLDDGRTVFFVQELTRDGAERMAAKINAGVADGEKGVPVYWGHPDVPELAHKYPDKRAKGWIKSATVEGDALVLGVEWLEENATDGFGWFSPYWGGPATDLGQGRYLKHLDSLTSVALINIPNIQEFRLANELLGTVNSNERTFAMPQHLIELAKRFDERMAALANEANYDESKHPRAEDGKWTSGGSGGSAGVNRKTKSERSTDSFKRRMDEEGEVTELNELEAKYIKLSRGNPFDLSPEAEKALSDFSKKKADLQKRGIIAERIRGAKPGEGFRHKSTTDEMKRRTPVNMGDGRSSWTEEERKKFSDPTSHLKFVELAKRFDERMRNK